MFTSQIVPTDLLYFLYIKSEVKQYYEALYLSYTNLGKNATSHNYSRQIALIQYSGRSMVGFLRNRSKISKITQYTASRFSLLTSAKFAAVREVVGCFNEHQQSYASTQ